MTSYHPKISIIIPVYNGSNYLKDAVDSALAQTYKNIEIIVVNDGSTDNGATEKIAKSYGDRVRYMTKKNGGVATALNLGIAKMTGEYFSWLSHDDMYYPEKVEKQIEFLSGLKDKKVVLYSDFSILEGEKIRPIILDHAMLTKKKKYSLLRGCVNGVTVLVPKTIFEDVGNFKTDLKFTQDYDCWMRIQDSYPLIHMQGTLSITRFHPGQESKSAHVIPECNRLWIGMVENLPDAEKLQYEGTLSRFYYEMCKFLRTTPYDGALQYCEDKLSNIESSIKSSKNLNEISSDVLALMNARAEEIKEYKGKISALEADNLNYRNVVIGLEENNRVLTETIEGIYRSKRYKIAAKLANIKNRITR